jgi:uncharacterized cupredoxin-like copper-binding protein
VPDQPAPSPSSSSSSSTAAVAVFISCVALIVSAVALGYALRTPRSSSPTPPAPKLNSVTVAEQEYIIAPTPTSVAAGPAEFRVTNNGNATHEFVLVKTDLADGALPRTADGKVDMTASSVTVVGQAQNIVAGASARVAATMAPGHYVMVCNITGHYAAGMHSAFDVTSM